MDWSGAVLNEFADFMLGDQLGEGMSRKVYQHPTDPTKVIKVENSARHFQNVNEWRIWNDFKHVKDVARWLAPCHSISHSGTFLIMDKAVDLPPSKKVEKLPKFLTDRKTANFGMIGGRVVARDYATSILILDTKMTAWRKKDWD